jgi:hypothetical protein
MAKPDIVQLWDRTERPCVEQCDMRVVLLDKGFVVMDVTVLPAAIIFVQRAACQVRQGKQRHH